MAKLTDKDILHVAKLAKLDLTKEEIDKFAPQLSSVINYFDELKEIETERIEPTSQTTGLENIKRKDEIIGNEILVQEEALLGTDKTHNGYFKVKAILEGRTDK